MTLTEKWIRYRDTRRGDYEFRKGRYSAVFDELMAMGLQHHHTVLDVGAGTCRW